jgi:hypothetical protein
MNYFNLLFSAYQPEKQGGKFTQLRPEALLSTISTLENRILERFPTSGLGMVCQEFRQQSVQAQRLVAQIARPIWPVRIFSFALIGMLFLVVFSAIKLLFEKFASSEGFNLADLVQAIDAAVNELIFLSVALFFISGIETRLKRHIALKAMHRLRSLAHVVDMHQLTKDPTKILSPEKMDTESSPKEPMTTFELARYLDYCSEMLSLMAKTAALFAQNMDDSVILNSVNDIESLTQGMASKIWQKIMILDSAVDREK